MVKKNFLKSSLIIALAVVTALTVAVMLPNKVSAASNDSESVSLTYSAHMQTYGDGRVVEAGSEVTETPTSFAGVTGESKRMESLTMAFEGPTGVSLKYQAHVQGLGWTTEVPVTKEGTTFVGTKGQSKRVEAVKITVVGLDKLTNAGYEIKYRAHVQGEGWQDWVTADANKYNETERNFAGTKGESRRIEAIEIVVAHVHQYEYSYTGDVNGVASHIKTCKVCNESVKEACIYEGNEASGSGNIKRVCKCGHSITTTLQDALDNSATALTVDKVESALTIKDGKTLTVTESLGTQDITINEGGKLLLTSKDGSNGAKLKGNGTVIWAPELESEKELESAFGNASFLKLSGGKLDSNATEGAKNLTFEIKVPELSKPQTITDQDSAALTLGEDWNVTIDLGKNTLATGDSVTNGGILVNKGNLTLKNGKLNDTKATPENAYYTIKNNEKGTLTLENIDITTKGDGIATKGILNMKNCTINGVAKESIGLSVGYDTVGQDNKGAMKDKVTTLDNVTINNVGWGIIAHSTDATINLTNTNITAANFALHTNARQTSNNTFVVNGGTYKTTAKESTVAYLASTGKSTFTNCTLEGGNGIETAGSALTLNGVTIKATGTANNSGAGEVKLGSTTMSGSAVILKLMSGYGDNNGMALDVKNSTLTSANGYAVNVAANTSLNTQVTPITLTYDSASYKALNGKLGKEVKSTNISDKVTTTVK